MAVLLLPGTVDPTKVLSGYTFSGGVNYGVGGSMVNRQVTGDDFFNSSYPTIPISKGANTQYGSYGTSSPAPRLAICPPTGYYPGGGGGYVTAEASEVASALGLTANKIAVGNNVCNIAGTFTSDANAVASHLLSGDTMYVNGAKIPGTMVNHGSLTSVVSNWTDGAGNLHSSIPWGAYISQGSGAAGTEEINNYDANYIASNILNTASVFGLQGTAISFYLISPGTNLLYNETATGFTTTSSTPVQARQVRITGGYRGTIRVKFDIENLNGSGNAYARIYKNGVAIGTLRVSSVFSWTTYAEDIAFSDGDYIQVYGWTDGTCSAGIRYFNLGNTPQSPTIG